MSKKFYRFLFLAITTSCLITPSKLVAQTSPNSVWWQLFQTLIQRSYSRSVEDAQEAQPTEVYSQLVAITPNNPQLIWREYQGKKQVLVSTWTAVNVYDEQVGKTTRLSREVWVTAAPQIQQFARSLSLDAEAKSLRLEQYLGLPANGRKTKFVQIWVNATDLFRPCPDPEIEDTQCDLQFPPSATEEHKIWIIKQMLSSYGVKGYPWTRLGYTYDWGNPDTEVGASEFVIKKGAEVFIEAVTPNEQYWR